MKNKLIKFISKGILALAMLAMPVQAKTVDIVGYKATLADGTVKKIADADSVAAALNDILAMIEKYHTDQSKTNDIPPIVVMYNAEWRLTDDEPWIISQSAAGNDIVPPTNMLPKMAYSRPLVMPSPPPEGVIPEETSLAIPATLTNMLECTFTGWKPEVPAKMPESNCVFVAQWQDPNVNQFTIKTTANGTNYVVYTAYFEEGESIADFNVTNPNYSVAFDPELPKTMPGTNFESYLTFTPNVPSTIAIDWKIIENVTTINDYVVGSELVPINQEIPDIVIVAFPRPLVGMPPLPEGTLPIGTQITIPNPENNIFYGSFKGWTPVVPEIVPETNCVFTANIEEPTFHSFVVKYTKDEEDYVVYSGRFVKGESIADFNVTNPNYSVAFDPELPKTMPDANIISYVEFTTNSITSNNITKAYYSDGSIQEYDIEGELGKNSINKTDLIAVEIGTAVTNIGDHAFSNCSGLTSVTIPDGVTNIGESAFAGCSGLTSITIPDSVTSIKIYAFSRCSGLISITIPDSVTSIGSHTFINCSGLTSIMIGNGVTSIRDSMFTGCSELMSITIPSSVTNIEAGAFWGCSGLTSITCLATTAPTVEDGSFGYNNSTFTGRNTYSTGNNVLKIPQGATGYDTGVWADPLQDSTACGFHIEYLPQPSSKTKAYYSDGSIQEYDIVGELDTRFSLNADLVAVEIGYSVTSIGSVAFDCCSNLTSITIPNSVTKIKTSAFHGCSRLTSITIPDSVTSIESTVFVSCSGLTSITIPNSVTSIGNFAFDGCRGLASITIPGSVTSIGNYAFECCSSLTTITIPASVTSIGRYAFSCCSNLMSITCLAATAPTVDSNTFGSLDFNYTGRNSYSTGNNVLKIPQGATGYDSGAWSDPLCNSEKCGFHIEYLPQPSSKTKAYYSDGSIQEYDIEGELGKNSIDKTDLVAVEIGDTVTSIGDQAFIVCRGLTSVTIPNSVTNIDSYAFSGCSGLTSLTIPDSVTRIGAYVFQGCSGLPSVTIGNGVTSLGMYMFRNCSGLTSVTIPNSVTNIDSYAFGGCSNLLSITIPDSVMNIQGYVFERCSNLSSITCQATTAPSVQYYTFGYDSASYTGRNSYSTGNNVLKVPVGATGYDVSYWADLLCNSEKCGFHIEYIDPNN